ncbi:MAG: class II aldolase/adducin family protein [SAR202 cluster bacterium]|nr:class II aldolase/adducin family protein [SAR202 cluster bacterium]
MSNLRVLRNQIVNTSENLVKSGILTRSNHGNLSVRVPGTDTFLLTSVSNFSQITEDEIGLFDFENNLIDGSVAPSSAEIIPMHGIIYKKRPEAGSVLHTHSKFATAFAVANKTIPVAYEAMVRFGFAESIPVAKYGPRGSQESIENIATTLDDTKPSRAILLENHGVLTFGTTINEAVAANNVIEESAEIIIYAESLGGAKLIAPEMRTFAQDRMQKFAEAGVLKIRSADAKN